MRLRLIRKIALLVPRYGKMMYCLYRDPRVPRGQKLAFLAALAAIYGPWDLPLFIPIVGEMDALALTALAIKVFVDRAPEAIVREHEERIRAGDSLFDRDLRVAGAVARDRLGEALRTGFVQLDQNLRDAGRTVRERVEEMAERWQRAGGERAP